MLLLILLTRRRRTRMVISSREVEVKAQVCLMEALVKETATMPSSRAAATSILATAVSVEGVVVVAVLEEITKAATSGLETTTVVADDDRGVEAPTNSKSSNTRGLLDDDVGDDRPLRKNLLPRTRSLPLPVLRMITIILIITITMRRRF
jgi:hypothetical protein